jgi:hypothetical protein
MNGVAHTGLPPDALKTIILYSLAGKRQLRNLQSSETLTNDMGRRSCALLADTGKQFKK